MADRQLPDQSRLLQLLRYEPETGKLYWLDRPDSAFKDGIYPASRVAAMWRSRYLGKEASWVDNRGYLHLKFDGVSFATHRVIWCMVYGVWPNQIDHDNRNPGDNRLSNLRAVTSSGNSRNRRMRPNNISGITGVYARGAKWVAQIGVVAGRNLHLGTFETFEEAVNARRVAEAEHNYHPAHGRKQA